MRKNYHEHTGKRQTLPVLKPKLEFRCRNYRLILPLFIMVLSMISFTSAAQTGNIQGVAPVQTPAGGFGVDGDAFANTPAPGYVNVGDWFENPGGTGGGLFDPVTGEPYAHLEYMWFMQDSLSGDPDFTTFLESNKINDHPRTYKVGQGNAPNKNEIQNVGVHFTYGDAGLGGDPGDLWCLAAADREVTNGSSYIDFEYLQNTLLMDETTGLFTTYGPDSGRTVGDVLVTVEYTKGGVAANVIVNEWTAVGDIFEYVPQPTSPWPYSGVIYATVNTDVTYVPFPAYDQWDVAKGMWFYEINQWCEVAVNLSELFHLDENPCFTLATLFVRTRTSGSSDRSELKDLPGPPIQINIESDPPVVTCGDKIVSACTNLAGISGDYETWKSGFEVLDFGIEPLDTISPDFPALPAGVECGWEYTHSFIVEDYCGKRDTATCTFTVLAPDALVINCPDAVDLPKCTSQSTIDADYANWVAGFTSSGDCNLDDNIEAVPALPANAHCVGADLSFTYIATGDCDSKECTSTFKVAAADELTINCPAAVDLPKCTSQSTIDTDYAAWVAGFTSSGDCNLDDNIEAVPALPANAHCVGA
ncbi:MAG: hypothetical protein ABFS10_14280, partial [Bacteroidota bacterium]